MVDIDLSNLRLSPAKYDAEVYNKDVMIQILSDYYDTYGRFPEVVEMPVNLFLETLLDKENITPISSKDGGIGYVWNGIVGLKPIKTIK